MSDSNKPPHVKNKGKAKKASQSEGSKISGHEGKNSGNIVSERQSTDEHDFKAFLFNIETIKRNLNKPLVDAANHPPLAMESDSRPEIPREKDYLDRITMYWIAKGLIPAAIVRPVPGDDDPAPRLEYPFYARIMASVAYSLQNPKAIDTQNQRNYRYALERFIDAHNASRESKSGKYPFHAFCIVDTDELSIPDHYGHTSYRKTGRPIPTQEDLELEALYRRALVYPTMRGENPNTPETEIEVAHPLEQCAENIALPYILEFVRDFLDNGRNGRKIVVGSLTLTRTKACLPFCGNCAERARQSCSQLLGLRIVDRESNFIYQSEETRLQWDYLTA